MKNIEEYIYLKDLVRDCGGIDKFRFFGHLDKYIDKYTAITPFGFALSSYSDDWVECEIEGDTSAGDLYTLEHGYDDWVECKIAGDLYTLEHGYKVKVVPVNDNRYAGRRFYQSDLISLIKKGVFILKTSDDQHIEENEGIEHICGSAFIYHHWYEIVND